MAADSPANAFPRQLAAGYYLENVERLLADVERRSADLLTPGERAFLDEFRALSLDARRLYVRLASRSGPWFRLDRLRYPEIAVASAIAELCASGFAVLADEDEVEARLERLRREEILGLARELKLLLGEGGKARSAGPRKAELVTALAVAVRAAGCEAQVSDRVPLLGLLRLETLDVLRLLFFGNLAQDWTEFVLQDLGVLRFEPYRLSERAFVDRAEVEEHLFLRRARQSAAELLSTGDVAAATTLARQVAGRAWRPSARRLVDGVLVPVGRALERAGEAEAALALLAAAHAPPARERRVRLLASLGRESEALALVAEIVAEPRDETERVFAAGFGERLAGRAAGRRRGRRRREVAVRDLEAEPAAPVESVALAALAGHGYRGFFAENWLWRSLFGLAFWDLVWAPVAGAFVQPFQYGPRDLHAGFRQARAAAVERRLAELAADPCPGPRLLGLWDAKLGTANRLVAFVPELRPHLELAAATLSGAALAAVCDRLSRDLGRYGKGFPDLFLVGPSGEILLAEVKAPGDQLRPEQRGWIEYLNEHGLPTEVVRLRWRRG